ATTPCPVPVREQHGGSSEAQQPHQQLGAEQQEVGHQLMYRDRPLYRNETTGAIIYWKLNCCQRTDGWLYWNDSPVVKQAPTGEWDGAVGLLDAAYFPERALPVGHPGRAPLLSSSTKSGTKCFLRRGTTDWIRDQPASRAPIAVQQEHGQNETTAKPSSSSSAHQLTIGSLVV
ncbi:unnamed protein product, partial [Amoebophrya sp. A25]